MQEETPLFRYGFLSLLVFIDVLHSLQLGLVLIFDFWFFWLFVFLHRKLSWYLDAVSGSRWLGRHDSLMQNEMVISTVVPLLSSLSSLSPLALALVVVVVVVIVVVYTTAVLLLLLTCYYCAHRVETRRRNKKKKNWKKRERGKDIDVPFGWKLSLEKIHTWTGSYSSSSLLAACS